MIHLAVDGLAEVRRTLLRLVPDLRREVTPDLAQQALTDAQQAADRHTQTGALVRSLKLRKGPDDSYEVYHDLQVAPHALFVHWGTRPHVIRPKDKQALRWVSGDGFAFAKIVHHPGYKGDPYLLRARTAVAQQFSRVARAAFNRVVSGIRRLF